MQAPINRTELDAVKELALALQRQVAELLIHVALLGERSVIERPYTEVEVKELLNLTHEQYAAARKCGALVGFEASPGGQVVRFSRAYIHGLIEKAHETPSRKAAANRLKS